MLRITRRTMQSAQGFLDYVNASPSPYHAVDESRKLLVNAGYKEWSEVKMRFFEISRILS